MAHKDIRIEFEIEGRCFEAVGFLNEGGEWFVSGNEMLVRTAGEHNGVIDGEDTAFLSRHRDQLPIELQPYWLVMRSYYDHSRIVSCFGFLVDRWIRNWGELDSRFIAAFLLVRRCA